MGDQIQVMRGGNAVDDDVFATFEYEDCYNCGDGAAGHVEMVDGLGNSHAVCISELLD